MTSTSLLVTGGLGTTLSTVATCLDWGLNGFPKPVPSNVELALAAALIFAAHVAFVLGSAVVAAVAKKYNVPASALLVESAPVDAAPVAPVQPAA